MLTSAISFPSVYERHNSELDSVSPNLLNGLKIYLNGESYIVGNLALTEGVSPQRTINSSPDELDYNLFLYSGLLLSNANGVAPVHLTTGFPFSTYKINRGIAETIIKGKHIIDFEAATFNGGGRKNYNTEVSSVEIMPEMLGNITALREGSSKLKDNFFVVSLGYGTCEAVLSTPNGIVQRTALSVNGIHYAVNMFIAELEKTHYLGLKTKNQMDVAFQNDYITLNRKRYDIRKLKESVLTAYYKSVISPALAAHFNDDDFGKANTLYLTGGGALYPDLVNAFHQEFNDIIPVEIVRDPLSLAARGYYLNSLKHIEGDEVALGLDIGNSNTVLAMKNGLA